MRWWLLLCLALLAPPLLAATVQEDPLERQMLEIAKDLRCTVCQNQPVAESNADLARDMRQIIREQLRAGKSRQEIMQYFVDRYGDYVLLKPPFDLLGAILWIVPPLLLLVIAIFAWRYQRQRLKPTPMAATLSPEDQERVRRARDSA